MIRAARTVDTVGIFVRDAHFSLVNDVDTTISNGNFLVDDQESQNEFKTSNSNMHNPG